MNRQPKWLKTLSDISDNITSQKPLYFCASYDVYILHEGVKSVLEPATLVINTTGSSCHLGVA